MGLGWTGSILAQELTEAGLNVVAHRARPLARHRHRFQHRLYAGRTALCGAQGSVPAAAQEAMTMRNDMSPDGAADARLRLLPAGQRRGRRGRALERLYLALLCQRFSNARAISPSAMAPRRSTICSSRTGASPMTRSSIATTSSNISAASPARPAIIKGQIQPGGNPFEGSRSREYPKPPLQMPYASTLFAEAARELGLHPFPAPVVQSVARLCQSAGRARWANAPIAASASVSAAATIPRPAPQTTILPVLMKKPNFEVRTECEVLKINLHARRQDAPRASPISTPQARNLSSPPTSSFSAAMA